jgi:hypothetical protein
MSSSKDTIDNILVVCPTKAKSDEIVKVVEEAFPQANTYIALKEFDFDLYLTKNNPDLMLVDGKPKEKTEKVGENRYVKVGSKTLPLKAENYAKDEKIPYIKASSPEKIYKKIENFKKKKVLSR